MSYNGSGTFQINTTGQPVVIGTVISATAFNALTADLATGLSTAITKDGQTATTARIPFAQGITSTLTTDATSTASGSIITSGGVGIAKALYVGTTSNLAGSVTFGSTIVYGGVTLSASVTGTGKMVLDTSPTLAGTITTSGLNASSAVATDSSKALVSVTNTGTGNNVLATSPTLITPILGTPTSATLTNATGLPLTTGVTGVLPEANGGTGSSAGNQMFKNRLINSAMVIDQRNAGASVTQGTAVAYTVDRWSCYGSVASKFTVQRNAGSVTPPTGYINYLGVTSSSAYTVGTSEFFFVQQVIEGFNIADLAFGTASAATVTLSFWVRSSLTGTFGGTLANGSTNRVYPFTYTISSANTWTQISVAVAGDTAGTWTTDNTGGLVVNFNMGAGATVSGTAGAWSGSTLRAPTGAVSVVGTNAATWYVTGVQLEKGSTATSFDYRPYGTELALCQRYFWNFTGAANYAWANGQVTSATNARLFLKHPVPMRASPTLSYTGTPYVTGSTGAGINVTAFSSNYGGATSLQLDATVTGGLTAGNACIAALNAGSDVISITAEL